VRFTAFDVAAMIIQASSGKPIRPIVISVSRTTEMNVDAGSRSAEFLNRTAISPKANATAAWPANFVRAVNPRLRCLRILM
jgi:hypothetical protein